MSWRLKIMAALLLFLGACSRGSKNFPFPWSELKLPLENLIRVTKGSDQHSLYAEYADFPVENLEAEVRRRLTAVGYVPACELFDGSVQGFMRGDHQILVRIDSFGPNKLSYLAIFDEKGKENLLHGSCFGRYQITR
jgi:hypothetical protein